MLGRGTRHVSHFRINIECNVLPILGFIRHTKEGRNTQLSTFTLHTQYTHAHLQEVLTASLLLSNTTKRRYQSNGFLCTVRSSYIYICTYVHIHLHIQLHASIFAHTYIYIYIYSYMHLYAHTYIYIYIYSYMHLYAHTYVRTYRCS